MTDILFVKGIPCLSILININILKHYILFLHQPLHILLLAVEKKQKYDMTARIIKYFAT